MMTLFKILPTLSVTFKKIPLKQKFKINGYENGDEQIYNQLKLFV
jgi:hypothetical protein